MPHSYTPGSGTAVDRIRFAIGDTDSSAAAAERLEDEEILDLLALYGAGPRATVEAARGLIAKLTRRATEKQAAGLRLVYGQRIEGLRAVIRELEAAGAGVAIPYIGGASVSDRQAVQADADRVAPSFSRGMLDNPRAEGSS